jgi:hypothetical protein
MPKTKHNPDASKLIDDYISNTPQFAQLICNKLRKLIKKADPAIIEDWKWGPNYNKNGMICGYGAFKEHVNFVFFQGALMKDPHKLFNYGGSNQHNRSIKFTEAKQIKDNIIIEYIKEAAASNAKGIKSKVTEIEIPDDFRKEINKARVMKKFEKLPYTTKKEWTDSVKSAKRPETRKRRISGFIENLESKSQ